MWKTIGYNISIDKCIEDKSQNATGLESVEINKFISTKQFKKIIEILKGE